MEAKVVPSEPVLAALYAAIEAFQSGSSPEPSPLAAPEGSADAAALASLARIGRLAAGERDEALLADERVYQLHLLAVQGERLLMLPPGAPERTLAKARREQSRALLDWINAQGRPAS